MMAACLDTSVLVALFFHEGASAAARERASRKSQLCVSRWTLAEFASAVAYKRRSAQTDEATALEAKARLRAVLADDGLQVADIERSDFERAATLCAAHASALRTTDALHAAGREFHAIACEFMAG